METDQFLPLCFLVVGFVSSYPSRVNISSIIEDSPVFEGPSEDIPLFESILSLKDNLAHSMKKIPCSNNSENHPQASIMLRFLELWSK